MNGLRKHFPLSSGAFLSRHVGDLKAVDGISFELHRNETLGVVGESGSGKSTIGRVILQLLQATEGSIEFDGIELTQASGRRLRTLRRDIQIVFQDPFGSLDPRMNVNAIIGEALKIHGLWDDGGKERVAELLDLVGLNPEHGNRYPHEFSGGQRQRIGIARAIALDPRVLVLDEPVSALDVSVQAGVINLLESLKARLGLSYIFIAHDLSVVRHISDRVAVHVSRSDRRDRVDASDLRGAGAPVHPGIALGDSRSRPGRGAGTHADPAHRRDALAGRSTQRLPLSHSLPQVRARARR